MSSAACGCMSSRRRRVYHHRASGVCSSVGLMPYAAQRRLHPTLRVDYMPCCSTDSRIRTLRILGMSSAACGCMSSRRRRVNEFTRGSDSQELFNNKTEVFKQKMRLIPSLQDLLKNATSHWNSPDHKNHTMFKENGFENYRGRLGIDDAVFNYVVRIGKAKFGNIFYDINLEVEHFVPYAKSASRIKSSTSNDSIRTNEQKSQENISDGEKFSLRGDRLEELRYNPTMFAKRLINKFAIKNVEVEELAGKLRELVVKHNKGGKEWDYNSEGEKRQGTITVPCLLLYNSIKE